MDCIVVRGGRELRGSVRVEGAKNAALPMLAASLLAGEGASVLSNVPPVRDVLSMVRVLRDLGARVDVDHAQRTVRVDASGALRSEVHTPLAGQIRASLLLLGPLVARCGRARLPAPGGCRLGARPLDLHVRALAALGADVAQDEAGVRATAPRRLRAADLHLAFPSVGATQNALMAAVTARGTTTIRNAAREPEVENLAEFLRKMGAKIEGAGSETITIEGVSRLRGAAHAVWADRIEAGTFMVAAALAGGDVLVAGAVADHNRALLGVLRAAGAAVREEAGGVRVAGPGGGAGGALRAVDVRTAPYPGLPTDLQPAVSVLLMHACGPSAITETLFEDRFQHLRELVALDASAARVAGDTAHLRGAGGADDGGAVAGAVRARELRGGAALVLAGLRARSLTVLDAHHVDRGYYRLHHKLRALGADVRRITLHKQT